MQKYYRLIADPFDDARWFLRAPISSLGDEIDARDFRQGQYVDADPGMVVPVRRLGEIVDFNFCDFDMVISTAGLNAKLEGLAGPVLQRIPVSVEGCDQEFEILNVCSLVKCIDEGKSEIVRWNASDGRADIVGRYKMITNLTINPDLAANNNIFRLEGWPMALIVSGAVKDLLESEGVSGIAYQPVC